MRAIHQFLTGATAGDAITGQALIIRRWLQEAGYKSAIYAHHIHPSMENEVRGLSTYSGSGKDNLVIYHHSIGSHLPDFLLEKKLRLVLIYHNITPPEFFARSDPQRMEMANLGMRQLAKLQRPTVLALAVSAYNARDLQSQGYENWAILPLALRPEDYDLPVNPALADQIRQKEGPNILFVGRLAPNKKQEELVKLLAYCRRIDAGAHLYLVGDCWQVGYDKWVEAIASELQLSGSVTLTGKVSQQDLITYYLQANVYVSMSVHEGFGLPLIESMFLGLPVLAFGSSGVNSTMGEAGIIFHEKKYSHLAELIHYVHTNQAFRARIVENQKAHVQKFLEPQVRNLFNDYLHQVI